MKTKWQGFTLIELMVVVAVVAILASIAYPSYLDSVRKTRLGQAKEASMHVGAGLERKAMQTNAYEAAIDDYKEYSNQLDYRYTRYSSNRAYVLKVTEKTERFKIWVVSNSKGTHCACSGSGCAEPTLAADSATCPAGTDMF